MAQTLKNGAAPARFGHGEGVLNVRFGGNSFDISLPGLDIGPEAEDLHVKRAVAAFLDVPTYRLDDYLIDRESNGNLTIRPDETFG